MEYLDGNLSINIPPGARSGIYNQSGARNVASVKLAPLSITPRGNTIQTLKTESP